MPGPVTHHTVFQILCSNGKYIDSRRVSISPRRQGSDPTQRNRRNQETFCGASMENPPDDDRRDSSSHACRQRCLECWQRKLVLDTQLGGPPPRFLQRSSQSASETSSLSFLRHDRELSTLSEACVLERKKYCPRLCLTSSKRCCNPGTASIHSQFEKPTSARPNIVNWLEFTSQQDAKVQDRLYPKLWLDLISVQLCRAFVEHSETFTM